MTTTSPGRVLQEVANQLVVRYLETHSAREVRPLESANDASATDFSYELEGVSIHARVKPDVYFGQDRTKIGDHELPFYREDTGCYALETVADVATRSPGWVFSSPANQILYLLLAVDQGLDEVVDLLGGRCERLESGLSVERSELHALPMLPVRKWFEKVHERYPARPVTAGSTASWVRLVPREDVFTAVEGVRILGPVRG